MCRSVCVCVLLLLLFSVYCCNCLTVAIICTTLMMITIVSISALGVMFNCIIVMISNSSNSSLPERKKEQEFAVISDASAWKNFCPFCFCRWQKKTQVSNVATIDALPKCTVFLGPSLCLSWAACRWQAPASPPPPAPERLSPPPPPPTPVPRYFQYHHLHKIVANSLGAEQFLCALRMVAVLFFLLPRYGSIFWLSA